LAVFNRITDHAVLRYLEAKYGLNLDKLEKEIMCEDLRTHLDAYAKTFKRGDLEFKIRDGKVTTVFGGNRKVPARKLNKSGARDFNKQHSRRRARGNG
jgi:hypothetical protein